MRVELTFLGHRYPCDVTDRTTVADLKAWFASFSRIRTDAFCLFYDRLCLGHEIVMPKLIDQDDTKVYPRFEYDNTVLKYYGLPDKALIHVFVLLR